VTNLLLARIAVSVLFLGVAVPVAAGPFEDGANAVKIGDFAIAMRLWRSVADRGLAMAQFNLGLMYDNGQGAPRDDVAAVSWYRKAADQGHAKAQSNLGFMYFNGRGVSQDYAEAVKWYRKAADQGDAAAQYKLGVTYDNGQGARLCCGGKLVSKGGGPGRRRGSIESRFHVFQRPGSSAGLCGCG
jgi:TPR repeat protein